MASITIRQLDDDLKQRLRLRAARNGRSMEDEVRTILRDASQQEVSAGPTGRGAQADRHGVAERQVSAQGETRNGKHVLLIIGGGIAAYKSPALIRRLKERGLGVRCILTGAAQEFITPLSASALSGERAFTELFDADSELDVGHIRLARHTDLIVVAPATA